MRALCIECRQSYEPDDVEIASIGLKRDVLAGRPFWKERGCGNCESTGFRGRKGVFELMEMDARLRDMTFRQEPHLKIREEAVASGRMSTLLEDGRKKVISGLTSVRELQRVVAGAD